MASLRENIRPDRSVIERQKREAKEEALMASNKVDFLLKKKAIWEGKTSETIHGNKIRNKVAQLIGEEREAALHERRKKLSSLYLSEKAEWERDLAKAVQPDPEKQKAEMASKAYALKKRREDERTQIVQEKLYQQWREGIDELRAQDQKLFSLQVTYERGVQADEKEERENQEKRENAIYDALWQEGYHAKVERELREAEVRGKLQGQVTATLGEQIKLKQDVVRMIILCH
jgi:hypothetical protein